MAIGTQPMTALDEAIALIDSLCAKLRTEADGGATGAASGTTNGTPAPIAPPVQKPWRTLASSTIPVEVTLKLRAHHHQVVVDPIICLACQWYCSARETAPEPGHSSSMGSHGYAADVQPSTAQAAADGAAEAANGHQTAPAAEPAAPVGRQQKKEKKEKKQAAPAPAETTDDLFGKAMLQVARVVSAEALPSSDKLYKTRVQVAGVEQRQIIAGLRKHIEQPQLEGSLVVVILNLKATKLAGELSEGMILAAVHKDESLPAGELVHPIRPSGDAEVGSRVYIEGTSASEAPPKVLKSGPWAQIKELLQVRGGNATFDGKPLVTMAGAVTAAGGMPDGAAIS